MTWALRDGPCLPAPPAAGSAWRVGLQAHSPSPVANNFSNATDRPITNPPAAPLAAITKTPFCARGHQDPILHLANQTASWLYCRLLRATGPRPELAARLRFRGGWCSCFFRLRHRSFPSSLSSIAPSQWTRVRSATAPPQMAHRRVPIPFCRSRLSPIPMTRMKVCSACCLGQCFGTPLIRRIRCADERGSWNQARQRHPCARRRIRQPPRRARRPPCRDDRPGRGDGRCAQGRGCGR